MATVKQLSMGAATFSLALATGFVMQNSDALASRFGGDTQAEAPQRFAQATQAPTEAMPALIAPATASNVAVILPASLESPTPADAPTQLATLDPGLAPDPRPAPLLGADCGPRISATSVPPSALDVSVEAPCHKSTPFTVHHQGMMFTALTDDAGRAAFTMPALAEVAVIIAAFDDGEGNVATTTIPDFAAYDRAVLQWQGDAAVMLSAYEKGAGFGDSGHIFAGNPGAPERVDTDGGFLMRLGENAGEHPLFAEVYTVPTTAIGESTDVLLSAEAEITSDNCGREIAAQSIQIAPSGQTSALDLTMVMPECDAVGDFLILQNMFQDLTLAAR
ncbi:hypothetical protein [Thalassorhabdomicrobium marinisediminis]|nr:hypothetical protein [Thalassorhabdomicrobium marinisediminis]